MAIGAAVKAGQLGYKYAPSLMNLGRRLFSPGPWKDPKWCRKLEGLVRFQK